MAFAPDFRRLKTREAVRAALGVSEDVFQAVLAFDPEAAISDPEMEGGFYLASSITTPVFFRHDIPKRNPARGVRTVWEPSMVVKSVYKALARRLDLFFRAHLEGFPHEAAFGFRVGRNIRENATPHAGHRHLLATDIEDFFPSISADRIQTLFRDLGCHEAAAEAFARFVTIGGGLPAGLPTSPVLSNAIALPLDRDLAALAATTGATYTRYADDMAFSGDAEPPSPEAISQVLEAQGFRLARSKTRRSKIGQAHFVTGLSISDPVRPHVPRRTKRQMRQTLYYAKKFGLDDHLGHRGYADWRTMQTEINRLDGLVKFIGHHEPTLASSLKQTWSEVLRDSGNQASFEPRNQHREPFTIFVDEAEFERNGRPVLALAMAATQHPRHIWNDSERVLQTYLSDLYADGRPDVIEKKGLHFVDATEDLRHAYAEAMCAMPFEGYVAFIEYDGAAGYEAAYLRLLEIMTPRRLMAAESQKAVFIFEENDKVSRAAIETRVMAAHADLAKRWDRHPKSIGIDYASKPHSGIALSDFLLGVLGRYLRSKPPAPNATSRDRLRFEKLRDKYRVILDVANGEEYSRRRPIAPWTEPS